MTDHKERSPDFSDLRRRAEERLKTEAVLPEELSPAEVGRLIRELKVSQIELEIQNEELRLTQARLEESRSRYADLYDFSPAGYLTLDPEGRIAEANLTAAKFLGVAKERLTGRFFSHFLEEADRPAFRRLITNTRFEPGKQGEFRLQGGNGGARTVLLDILFLQNAESQEQCRLAMTDITELKRTQEELRFHKEDLEDLVAQRVVELIEVNYQLRQSNEKLKAVIDYSPLAVIHLDNQGRVLSWNPAAERTFGWRAAEVVGGPLPIVPEEKQEESAAIIRRLLQGEHFTGLELRRQRKDGGWIDVSVSMAPVRDEQGTVSGLVGIGEDITARKRAEETLKTQAMVLESMAEGVTVTDDRGYILYTNPAFDAMFGYEPGELLGRHSNILNHYPPEENTRVVKEILQAVDTTGVWSGEFHNRKKDGSLLLTAARISALKAGGKKLFISVQEDITERRRYEEEIRRLASFAELNPHPIMEIDEHGAVVYANPAAWNLAEKLQLPEGIKALVPPGLKNLFKEVGRGAPRCHAFDLRLKDFTFSVNVHFPHDLPTARLYALDITERQRAEEVLRRQAELLDLAKDAILVRDLQGRITFWNQGAAELYGFTPEEALGQRTHELLQTAFPVPLADIEAQILKEGCWQGELRQTTKDGRRLVISSSRTLGRDAEGRPQSILVINTDITERQRAEEALRKSEARFRKVFENAATGIVIVDWEGRFQQSNPAYCALLGYTEEELRRINFASLIHPEDREANLAAIRRLQAGELLFFDTENRYVRKDGQSVWVHKFISVLTDSTGKPSHLLGLVTETTERKLAEQALRESEARERARAAELQALFDAVPAFVLLAHDPEGRRITGNSLAYEFLGVPVGGNISLSAPEEERPRNFRVIKDGVEIRPEELPMRRAARGESVRNYELDIVLTSGARWSLFGNAIPLRDDSGNPRGAVSAFIDITARRQAEEALRESEARYRAVGELIPYGIWTANPHGGLEFISKSFLEMTGKTLEECQKYGWLYLLPDEDIEATLADWQHCLKTGSFWDYEHKIRIKDGDYRTILSRGVPLADSEGRITSWVGINLDITERKAMEEGLRRARDELESRVEERTRELQLAYDSLRSEMKKHQRTADRLRESEARFSAFMRHLPGIAVMRDTQGRYLFANDTWERLLGKTRQDWQGKTVAEIWSVELAREFSASDHHILTTGQSLETVHEFDLANGRRVYLTYTFPILDDNGLPYMVGAIGTDITERRRAEEALNKNEAMLRLILDTLPVGVWVADKDGRIVQSNPAARHIWGGARGVGIEQYGEYKGWWADTGQRLAPQDWSLARAVQKGETSLGEVIHIEGFDGSRKTILNSAAPLFGENREILGAIAVNEDITDLRRAEKVMLQQARQVEAFFAHNLNPLVFLDRDFNFLRVNEAYARACQREIQEFIGRNHFEFYPDAENEALFRSVVETKSSYVGLARPFEFPDHPEWGVTYWDWSLAPILDEAGEVDFLVFSLNDVTERKRAEIEAERQNALIAGINGIFREALVCETEGELAATCLAVAEELTGSMFGFIDELNEAGNLDVLAFSEASLEQRRLAPAGDTSLLQNLKARGLLAKPIETGEPIIANDPAAPPDAVGLPPGHPPLTAYLGVPLKHGDKVIGLLRLGNKKGGYIHRDLEDMENLGGAIVEAWMRKRAETTARRHAAVVAGINRIFREALTCETLEDLGRACLGVAEELSGSRFGFIDLVNEDGTLDLMAISDLGRQACRQAGKKKFKLPAHVPVRGIYRSVIEAGTSLIANDPASHPDWLGLPKGYPALTSYLGVPLKQGRQVLGQIGLGNRESGYRPRELETIEALAVPIAEAILHKQAADALQESEESLHILAGQLLEVQETERRRLSRELHDGLGQSLLVLKFKLSCINAELSPAKQEVCQECQEALKYMDSLINEVRHLSRDLSPGPMEELGLTAALKYLCEESCKHYKILPQSIKIENVDGIYEPLVENNIYRIFQETLTNVGKHAEATRISVTVKKQATRVSFTVRDNGQGFKVSEALARQPGERGIGLASMQERVRMMGGTMDIWSREGKGTRIIFTVPRKPE